VLERPDKVIVTQIAAFLRSIPPSAAENHRGASVPSSRKD
jgi:hypothetical protein